MIQDWKNLPCILASALYMLLPNYSPHNSWGNPFKKCCSETMLLLYSKSSATQGFCIVSTNTSEKSYEILFNSQIHTTLPFELSALSMLDISWQFQETPTLYSSLHLLLLLSLTVFSQISSWFVSLPTQIFFQKSLFWRPCLTILSPPF